MLRNLKKLRVEANVSQKTLAEAIGVSQQSINKYENHNIEPDIETLIQIADFFHTSVDFLIGHTDIRRKIEQTHSYDLNDEECVVVGKYRKLNKKQRNCIEILMDTFTE